MRDNRWGGAGAERWPHPPPPGPPGSTARLPGPDDPSEPDRRYYCYIPIPFKKSLKIVFEGEKIMFHQIQARKLSGMEVESWTCLFF